MKEAKESKYAKYESNKRNRKRYNKIYYGRTAYLYEPRPWTEDEDAMVLEHTITDPMLSPIIQRSVAAIQIRRQLLRKQKMNQ